MNKRQVVSLSRLKFDDVMNYYPKHKHNRDVYNAILELHKNKGITPFIGAGLSVFCGYRLWPGVLTELAEYIPVNKEKSSALNKIKHGHFLEAAQEIQTSYKPMLSRLPNIVDYKKIEACPPEIMWASADWVLPYLFEGSPVMTTNFDRVLEHIFSKNAAAFEHTLNPYDPGLLTQMRQQKSHGLFKLHGDIGEKTTSLKQLVFTLDKYNEVYAAGGDLVTELKQWYENQTLLFLGCSLTTTDKTMEVLKSVVAANPSVKHYAIIDCPKKNLGKRVNELAELGIDAIFYDSSNHDAVRVILERLLEETDPDAFKRLHASRPRAKKRKAEERPMMYDSGYIPFTGRQEEWDALDAFCACDADTPLWWAVTGPGGMGKSRLVYEFTREKQKQGWEVQWFSQRELPKLGDYTPGVHPTIVVLDDVQAHMQTVGQWMEEVEDQPRSEKLRILLLEREGVDMQSASWLRTMHDGSPYSNPLREWCHDETFLSLKAMNDGHLKTIMSDYAAASGNTLNAEQLLKTLEKVDPNLKRPLYALAIADARCKGNDPTNWSADKILDTLLTRELDFHINRLRGLVPGLKVRGSLQGEFENLLARSCVRGCLMLDDIPADRYPKLCKLMEDERMDPFEFYEAIGIGHNAIFRAYTTGANGNIIEESPEEEKQIIALDCPDLIKEHLVLQQALDRRELELLLPDGWANDPGQLMYLRHLLEAHPDRLKSQDAYWTAFMQTTPAEGLPAWIYGNILWGVTELLPLRVDSAITRLADLYADSGADTQIAESYAHGLFNLTVNDSIEDSRRAVESLAMLYSEHADSQEIITMYALGLLELSAKPSLTDRDNAVCMLEHLYANHLDCPDLSGIYAAGLYNLTVEHPLDQRIIAVDKLKMLYSTHPDSETVVVRLADALRNLCVVQSSEEIFKNIAPLRELYNKFPVYNGIACAYADMLVGLALSQKTEADVLQTLTQSKAILNQHPSDTRIQLYYAKTWFNLTLQQSEADIPGTVAEIAAFLREHSQVIPDFKEALDKYLSEHPDHTARYQVLRDL